MNVGRFHFHSEIHFQRSRYLSLYTHLSFSPAPSLRHTLLSFFLSLPPLSHTHRVVHALFVFYHLVSTSNCFNFSGELSRGSTPTHFHFILMCLGNGTFRKPPFCIMDFSCICLIISNNLFVVSVFLFCILNPYNCLCCVR